MPLFMAIVGYFATALLDSKNILEPIIKKCRQLLLPAITFSVFMIVIGYEECNNAKDFIKHCVFDLWFLKSAFMCSVLFVVSCWCSKLRPTGIIVSLILSQTIDLHLFNIMYPCFILGYFIRNNSHLLNKHGKSVCVITGILFVCMLFFWNKEFWIKPSITLYPSSVDFGEYWFKTIYRILIGSVGTLFFFTLSHIYIPNNQLVKKWGGVGMYTLCIYMFQTLAIERILCVYINLTGINPLLYNFIITPSIAVVVIFLCLQIGKLISKSDVASFLFFGKLYKPKMAKV